MYAFKVVCAWCQAYIRGPVDITDITHGICEDCTQEQFRRDEEKARKEGL